MSRGISPHSIDRIPLDGNDMVETTIHYPCKQSKLMCVSGIKRAHNGILIPTKRAKTERVSSPPDAVIRRGWLQRDVETRFSPLEGGMKRVERKSTRQARMPKSTQTLEQRLTSTDLTSDDVAQIISQVFEEQEMDDRNMYKLSNDVIKATTDQCELSKVMEDLESADFRRMLTYGEVSVESLTSVILPLLNLQQSDVFYDLGCGTGKIVVQVALQTPCMVSKGIELMENRVREGSRALKRLETMDLPILHDKDIHIVHGDILKPPPIAHMMDATVVFINNVCFGPELMLQVMKQLSLMPNLRRVVTLRRLCERHRPRKCTHAGNYCMEYVHPPTQGEIHVSWADKTSVYLYERIDFAVAQLAEQMQRTIEKV